MYIKKFVEDEEEKEKLMELVEMKKDLFHSTIDTIIDRGVRKAERKFVRSLIEKDYKIEEISNLLDLDEDYILYLLD